MEIAHAQGFASIAFPSISTGIFGFPFYPAAGIAIATAVEFTKFSNSLREILFCCFSPSDLQTYQELLSGKSLS